MDLAGRHVVVTGAARGIGLSLARAFHAAGAVLTMADVEPPTSAAATLGAAAVGADVATEAGNVRLITAARAAHGPIDLFFANAGVGCGRGPLDTTEAEWDLAFDVNIHAHRWAAKHLLGEWLDRGEGYFCSTASAAGLLTQIGSAPYSVTKHAAVAFAEWLSVTYGDRGLLVSCLCPQGVNTAMINGGIGAGAASGAEWLAANVVRAAGEVLEPDDVAAATLEAIGDERFLVLPHPEVADFLRRKAADPDRWIAGMRRFQSRISA